MKRLREAQGILGRQGLKEVPVGGERGAYQGHLSFPFGGSRVAIQGSGDCQQKRNNRIATSSVSRFRELIARTTRPNGSETNSKATSGRDNFGVRQNGTGECPGVHWMACLSKLMESYGTGRGHPDGKWTDGWGQARRRGGTSLRLFRKMGS